MNEVMICRDHESTNPIMHKGCPLTFQLHRPNTDIYTPSTKVWCSCQTNSLTTVVYFRTYNLCIPFYKQSIPGGRRYLIYNGEQLTELPVWSRDTCIPICCCNNIMHAWRSKPYCAMAAIVYGRIKLRQ